jgi:DnaJ-class molecular chaperone
MNDPYKALGLPRGANAKQIKKAFKKLARRYHPDRNSSEEAVAKFKAINAAHDILSDPEKKRVFDTFGAAGFDGGARGRPRGGSAGVAFEGNPFGDGFRDVKFDMGGGFEDLLGSMFGAGGPKQRPRGMDQTARLQIDYKTMILGGERTITIGRPDGSTDRLIVKIPPGVHAGGKLRLKGQGAPPPGGGPCGDLHIEIHYSDHPTLRRSGKRDLEYDVPITVLEAMRGTSITVPTPTGDVKVTVPPGVGSGCKLRLKGRGIQSPSNPGDLFLRLVPTAPVTEDPAALAAAEALEAFYLQQVRQKVKDSI